MPVRAKTDSKGSYYQFGDSGDKYYYTPGDEQSRLRAKRKAEKQMRAIYASGYKGE